MKIKIINELPSLVNVETIYWGVEKLQKKTVKSLPKNLQTAINDFQKLNYFNEDNELEKIKIVLTNKQSLYLINGQKKITYDKAIQWCSQNLKFELNTKSVLIDLDFLVNLFEKKQTKQAIAIIIKSIVDNLYQFNRYKSESKNFKLKELIFFTSDVKLKPIIEESYKIYSSTDICKDLANLPPNICNPKFVVDYCENLFKDKKNIKLKILDQKQMSSEDMNSLLAVARGSVNEPYLVNIEYKGNKSKNAKNYVLVGKGITFDTGGISLKPAGKMDEMKFDMCGSATVIGVLNAVSELNLPINIVGTIALAENMPAGNAYRPGDILSTMSGKTVEVLNTDAEGRLILCDALTYVQKHYKSESIIDIATLTGACVVALGHHHCAVYANDDILASQIIKSGEEEFDEAWRMPLGEKYHKQLESKVADMGNIGGMPGGSITAACFLEKFIEKNQQWSHLDIAGIAWDGTKKPSGRPVPMLTRYFINKC